LRPCLGCEWFCQQELSGLSVQHVEKRVAVAPVHELPLPAAKFGIYQHGNLHGIPVVNVMRRELKVPFQLARVCVEGNHTQRIKIVSPPDIAVPIRRGVTGAPVNEVERGIERSSYPRWRAAGLP